jgi:hypothetical protein
MKERFVPLKKARFRAGELFSFVGHGVYADMPLRVRVADRTKDGRRTFLLIQSRKPLRNGNHGHDEFQIEDGKIRRAPTVTGIRHIKSV